MSRRVQFQHIEYISRFSSPFKQPAIVIYAPAGKVVLEHDPEDLLLAFADVLTKGGATYSHRYVVNGVGKYNQTQLGPHQVMHGWIKCKVPEVPEYKATRRSSEIFFDAAEVVDRGEVWWKLATAKLKDGSVGNIPWSAKPNGLYTKAEILRIAATCLFLQ